jgi:hypothetical protein
VSNLPQVRNFNRLQQQDGKHAEIISDLLKAHGNVAAQLATDPNGADVIPPRISQVEAAHLGNGLIDAAITDNGKIVRAVNYFLEYDTTESFSNPRVIDLGSSRNTPPFILPNGTYFFRAYSQYKAGGPPSEFVVFPGSVTVTGGVSASLLSSQSSGTGKPNQGGHFGAGKTLKRSR